MKKLPFALATLALLSAPAFAGSNYGYNRCNADTYACERFSDEAYGKAGFLANGLSVDEREERRIDEKNDGNDGGNDGGGARR